MSKRLHDRPFDEGTITKLKIFNDYIVEWIPVFLPKEKSYKEIINICDFFSGPGMDSAKTAGSPLLIIEALVPYHQVIKDNNYKVNLLFNDSEPENIKRLTDYVKDIHPNIPYYIEIRNKKFNDLFAEKSSLLSDKRCANLLLLDQGGVKEVPEDIFHQIINFSTTDFLLYITSSTFRRFGDQENMKNILQRSLDLDPKIDYNSIHRTILDVYKRMIPEGKEYYLAPFSIKKNSNIYGIIFGAAHLLALNKFLDVAWKVDSLTGDSNYDIDGEKLYRYQDSLFPEYFKPKKLKVFENDLKKYIFEKRDVTNLDLYKFTLENGFLPRHAKDVIKKMKSEDRIKTIKFVLSSDLLKDRGKITKLDLR